MLQDTAAAAPASAPAPDGVDARLLAVLRSFVRSSMSFGRHPGDQFERAARALCARIVRRSLDDPRPVFDARELHEALTQKSSLPFDTTGVALVTKAVLSRVGPLKMLAGRTPWLMAATAVPDVYAALARGHDEVAIVSSFLVHRGRRAGVEIDPERLRRVTVQLLQRRRIDPASDPSDADLVSAWIRRAVRSALPFTRGGGTRHARSIAAAAADVDPSWLH